MIKFIGNNTDDGRPVLGIGLSRANCEKLLEGLPISLEASELGLPPLQVFLFAGETEAEMTQQMLSAGAITPDQIQEDKRLADPFRREVN